MKNTSPLNRFPDPEKNSSVVYHDFSRQIEELSIDLHKDKRTKPIHENSYKNPSISDYSDLDKISDIPIANKPHIKNPSTISFDPSFKFNQSNFLKNIDSSENYQRILEIVEAEKAKLQKKLQDLNELYSAEKFLASQAISDLKVKNYLGKKFSSWKSLQKRTKRTRK